MLRQFSGDVPHCEFEFQSWLMSYSYILHTRHFLLHTGHFLLHTGRFLLWDSYHMTITIVIFCKQKAMGTLFCLLPPAIQRMIEGYIFSLSTFWGVGGGPRSQIFRGGPRSQIFRVGGSQASDFSGGSQVSDFWGGSQVSDFWGGTQSQIFGGGVPSLSKGKNF